MIEVEVRDKRVEDRDGGKTFACELVAVSVGPDGGREDVALRSFAYRLDNATITTERVQRVLDQQKKKLLRETGNVAALDLDAIH